MTWTPPMETHQKVLDTLQVVHEIAKLLEEELKEQLVQKIAGGFANLSKIRKTENPFAELDYGKIADNLFLLTSEKYVCAFPPSAASTDRIWEDFCPLNIAPPRKKCSDFARNYTRSRGKVQQSNRGSYNVYHMCIRTSEMECPYQNLRQGQVVKQKFQSEDGKWIFGWTRRGMFSRKIWECYPASSLRRVSV